MLHDMQDETHTEMREFWVAETREEAKASNPLRGYCRRVYFERTSCKRRGGPKKGKVRGRTTHEVELLMFLPSGRCVTVRDAKTPGLDALAEEVFSGMALPTDTNVTQLFLDYFRQL